MDSMLVIRYPGMLSFLYQLRRLEHTKLKKRNWVPLQELPVMVQFHHCLLLTEATYSDFPVFCHLG